MLFSFLSFTSAASEPGAQGAHGRFIQKQQAPGTNTGSLQLSEEVETEAENDLVSTPLVLPFFHSQGQLQIVNITYFAKGLSSEFSAEPIYLSIGNFRI